MTNPDCRLLPRSRLDDLIAALAADGFEVIGPRVDQGAIVYGPIRSSADLPIGWTDRQGPGEYRLEHRTDDAYFGYAVGPHSWKKYLFPSVLRLWEARRTSEGITLNGDNSVPPRRAFLGVRSCELHAIAVQDRVFLGRAERFTDPHYRAARNSLFIIAVECTSPAATCFCTSMGTGPDVQTSRLPLPLTTDTQATASTSPAPVDLVLTELADAFVVRSESEAGRALLDRLGLASAEMDRVAEGRERVTTAARSMSRTVNAEGVRDLLQRNQEHPRWDDVANRCLGCTNCTLVCPTCFCASVEDEADLRQETATRVRRWDSCFNPDFARVHGGDFRPSLRGRYRQWLTHKFASWHDQFGVSGCVGCGRCIAWCPAGIDVTEEIAAIGAADGVTKGAKP